MHHKTNKMTSKTPPTRPIKNLHTPTVSTSPPSQIASSYYLIPESTSHITLSQKSLHNIISSTIKNNNLKLGWHWFNTHFEPVIILPNTNNKQPIYNSNTNNNEKNTKN